MGSEVEDVALTIHPHPPRSESVAFATGIADGPITDVYISKKK